MKNRLKPSNSSTGRNTSHESVSIQVFRSRSIDSMSGNDQMTGNESAGLNDEKPQNTATLATKFRTLRKRLSRTSNSTKPDNTLGRRKSNQNEKDNTLKSGGDDSEASSAGEEFTQLSFTEIPISNPVDSLAPSTAVGLRVHRSLPAEKTPPIVPSLPSNSVEINETNNDSGSSNENPTLSKTWSSGTFTGAQLHGTCSIEYSEHMKDKSHKRKAHVIDLRKDDVQHHQQHLATTTITPISKHTISTCLTSYHTHT